jgi:hypothetical protein
VLSAVVLFADYCFFVRPGKGRLFTPIVGMIVGAVILAASFIWWYQEKDKPAVTSHKVIESAPVAAPPNPEASRDQFVALRNLSAFIAADENELREAFDFRNTLTKNISVQNIRIGFRNSGKLKDFLYTNYTEGDGTIIWWAAEGKYHMTPGGPHVDAGPRDVFFLVTTQKYQLAEKQLIAFINSPLIPESIKIPLKEYKTIVDNDFELMIRTLNTYSNQGDDFFLKSQEYGGKFYGVINNAFVVAFTPLKPSADRVAKEIARYLKTD